MECERRSAPRWEPVEMFGGPHDGATVWIPHWSPLGGILPQGKATYRLEVGPRLVYVGGRDAR
jgi:hypothetical protein